MNVKGRVDNALNISKKISLNFQDASHNKFFRCFSNRCVIGEHLQEQLLIIERYIKALELNKDMVKQIDYIQNLDDEDKNQKFLFYMFGFVSEFLKEDGYYE